MLNLFLNGFENKPLFIHKKLFQRLSDQFHQNAFESIKGDNSKLRTYSIFKTNKGFEGYLTEIEDLQIRTQLTKFRLSNHNLMIETGRHKKLTKEMRVGPFCPNLVETESHFILNCSTYNTVRNQFFNSITENEKLQ